MKPLDVDAELDDTPNGLLLAGAAFSSGEAGLDAVGAKENVAAGLDAVTAGTAGVDCPPKAKPANGFFAAGGSASFALLLSPLGAGAPGAADAPNENPEKGDATFDGAVEVVEFVAAGVENENPEKGVAAGAAAGVGADG